MGAGADGVHARRSTSSSCRSGCRGRRSTLIANYRAIKHDDADALLLAQRWSKYMAVTFAVGAVTGTVLTFEFGLLWPRFMGQWGDAFGVPFAFEGLFFFTRGDLHRDLHLRLAAAEARGRTSGPACRS